MIISADIGGTQMRAAVFSVDGDTQIRQKKIATKGKDTPLQRLFNLIIEICRPGENIRAIAIAAPGPVDPKLGIIMRAPNIPEWVDFPLARLIQEKFSAPVFLGNDANLAALGEWRFGAGQGHHNLVYITISTGIGGGVILDDRLVLGERGLAAELGHVTVDPNGPLCGCGHRGHIEAISSGTGIAHYVAEQIAAGRFSILNSAGTLTARDISLAAEKGDELCQEALGRAGHYLGIAIANYLHIFNPSIVILGGGVSASGPLLFDPLHKSLRESVFAPGYLDGFSLKKAALGDDVGLLGAFVLGRSSNS